MYVYDTKQVVSKKKVAEAQRRQGAVLTVETWGGRRVSGLWSNGHVKL